jgi:valyl-tRNA synthetase
MARPVLDKVYNPLEVESRWYRYWMDNGLFHADAKSPKPRYTVMIPPPNVTGMLTMGHILNNTLQDLLVRWKRMDGFESLWMPGTDHAGIATQNKVEAALKAEGLTRHDLGREKLIARIWEWKEKYGGIILGQLRKLGASCDWERERFTMDEGLSRAVREVFVRLYEKKLIYRGRRLINWCPRCQTALADEEAPASDVNGKFWTIAYPIEGSDGTIRVSTTRPETLLGDTAVAVHPDDDRYKALVGKTVILPLMNRRIPIVADEYADPEKGSGAVKITPAHDFNDFEVAGRHGLEAISVIDDRGVMNENAGPYKGLDRFEARKRILDDLTGRGLLLSDEPRVTPIPHCYRCSTVVEPFLSDQWFVRMQPLAEPALAAVEQGRIRFHPKQWEETYFHWMRNIRDWCISRQVWWGHRIPVWTCGNGHMSVHRDDNPAACPECGSQKLEQDPDVLDTWFSSWLWPFSTLGWPEKTDDLKAFFPTDSLVTGPDIIFFWVARMIMASLEFTGDVPFRDVYFNGMIRDLSGRKMSKSLGNSPDPIWLIDGADAKTVGDFAKQNPSYKAGVPAYGADAIRLTMLYQTPLGGDVHFDHPLVEMGQKFANKLWNASRFVMMNLDENQVLETSVRRDSSGADLADRWILSRLNAAAGEIRSSLEQFRFNEAAQALYRLVGILRLVPRARQTPAVRQGKSEGAGRRQGDDAPRARIHSPAGPSIHALHHRGDLAVPPGSPGTGPRRPYHPEPPLSENRSVPAGRRGRDRGQPHPGGHWLGPEHPERHECAAREEGRPHPEGQRGEMPPASGKRGLLRQARERRNRDRPVRRGETRRRRGRPGRRCRAVPPARRADRPGGGEGADLEGDRPHGGPPQGAGGKALQRGLRRPGAEGGRGEGAAEESRLRGEARDA